MMSYYCRHCGHWLFDSDATTGQVRHRCSRRDCHALQTVYLGGYARRDQAARQPQQHREPVRPTRPA